MAIKASGVKGGSVGMIKKENDSAGECYDVLPAFR